MSSTVVVDTTAIIPANLSIETLVAVIRHIEKILAAGVFTEHANGVIYTITLGATDTASLNALLTNLKSALSTKVSAL